MKRWTIVLVLGLAAFIFTSCQVAEPTEEEVAQVYAAVIRQIYTEDDTHGGSFQPPRLYVVGTTDDRAGLPSAEEGASTEIARTVREAVTSQLSDLPAAIIWIESQDEVALDPYSFVAGGGAIITLGNIQPQQEGVVHVPASIYIAQLGAGGQTYIVEKVDGVWMITGNTGVEWISQDDGRTGQSARSGRDGARPAGITRRSDTAATA